MICTCPHFEEHIWPHAFNRPRGLLTLRTDARFPCVRTISSIESIFISDHELDIPGQFDYDRHDGVPQSTPLALLAFRSEKLLNCHNFTKKNIGYRSDCKPSLFMGASLP